MTVTVAGKNYTQISSCDSSTAGGTWLILVTTDSTSFKEGSASLCGVVKNAGATIITFTPTSAVDLSGTKHVRFWFLTIVGGLLETYALDGLNFWASDGTNTGYWKILGRDTYPGGWINCVIDVSKNCDSGTKPTNMNAITSMGYRVTLTALGKNVTSTWTDNLCICDGLVAYGDDAGGYFDLEDVFTADNATTGGWGILRKIGGQYFATGLFEIGYATSATKFQTKSSVLVFENRRVNDALYTIKVVDSGNASYTTEFILGSESGGAGIEGCMIRTQDLAQTCKYLIEGAGANVDNFKMYGTTFFDTSTISLPPNATNVKVLSCNFEACAMVLLSTCIVENCNFIAADNAGARVTDTGDTPAFKKSNLISCPYGVRIPNTGTYKFDNLKFSGSVTADIDNTSGGLVTVNCVNGANPTTYTGNTTINNYVDVTVTVKDEAQVNIQGVSVRVSKLEDNAVEYMNELTNVSGIATESINYPGAVNLRIRVRKSSTGIRYIPMETTGVMTTTGFALTVTLYADGNIP